MNIIKKTVDECDIHIEEVSILGKKNKQYRAWYHYATVSNTGEISTHVLLIGTYSSVSNVLRAHRNLQKKQADSKIKGLKCSRKDQICWDELGQIILKYWAILKGCKSLDGNGIPE